MSVAKFPKSDGNELVITPTLSTATGIDTNTAVMQLRDGGRRIQIEGLITWNDAGSGGAVLTVTLPTGYNFDDERIAGQLDGVSDKAAALIGICRWYDAGVGQKTGVIEVVAVDKIRFIIGANILLHNFFAANDGLNYNFEAAVKRV